MRTFLILFFFLSLSAKAQTIVSGVINPTDLPQHPSWVYLSQVLKDTLNGEPIVKMIAKCELTEASTFRINTHLPEEQQAYIVQLANSAKGGISRISSRQFLLANKDSIYFTQGIQSLKSYTNTNKADKEWQKYNTFKNKVAKLGKGHKKFLNEIRSYAKDSLQILAVKLLTVKELDERLLLDTDIKFNRGYYTDLLNALKQSDINPLEYAFLELKLGELLVRETRVKYTFSFWINILLGLGLVGLLTYLLTHKKSQHPTKVLSKQELVVKNLIIQGNSNKEIAQTLFISLSTVKSHITSIYQKLNLKGRQDLMEKYRNTTGY